MFNHKSSYKWASLPKLRFPPTLVFVALFHPAKQITMDLPVAACISADDVTMRVDSVCFGKPGCRNVNRLEVALPQQKSMHVSLARGARRPTQVVPADLPAWLNAGDP